MPVSTKTLTVLNKFYGLVDEIDLNKSKTNSARILDILNAHKVNISQSCGGSGTCTTCKIEILKGQENVSQPSGFELEIYQERGFDTNQRLACQTEIYDSAEIKLCLSQD